MKQHVQNTAETVAPELVRELLESSEEITVIHWLRPAEHTPEEASYILIKQDLGEEGLFCLEGAYENGRFWDMAPGNAPLEKGSVLGWSYLPFDARLKAAV